MFAQLGNIIFEKQYVPQSMERTAEASFVEHALINIKPRLQPVGNNLEEVELSVELRADLLNIPTTLLQLNTSRTNFEILPLLMGTGEYKGDFVITKFTEVPVHTLDDGYPVIMAVTISLKEYAIADRLAQQQNNERKNAFAVGDINPSRLPPIPKYTPQQISSQQLAMVSSHNISADAITRQFENNVSAQSSLSNKMEKTLGKMSTLLASSNDIISALNDNLFTDLLGKIGNVSSVINSFTFPISDVSSLKFSNTQLQAAMLELKQSSTILNNQVLTRRA